MNLQPILSNDLILIRPLQKEDFNDLYAIASDKLLWEQHPNNDRYIKEVFQDFFQKALDSKGAFVIIDQEDKKIIGSSRYYDLNIENSNVVIGFTFLSRKYWGTIYNATIKKLMLDYAFNYVDDVHFHVGKTNFRSQKAMEKLGGKIIGHITSNNRIEGNPVYGISKKDWLLK
ncbi:GNAT family N-acetyltransferase [Flavobacterium sp. 9AF]|uniref:GNAT family N-acetyltransferase n=1 Tax=Flavobacterium sp. 9AF TaxID=2653142 RepID=UPI0012EFB18D|nr:GNAT family N-acetyltransferase [Flavobacterium sp. 9AF]VXB51646.1 GNAT family N-acetyltransferase [Flavobacterium sp. 9AF]